MSTALTLHGREVDTAFDLLGYGENALTAALGYTLSRSPELLEAVLQHIPGGPVTAGLGAGAVLAMEDRDNAGRTDLEIRLPGRLLVVEAKKGWNLPTEAQLGQYANRVTAAGGGALVTLSTCSTQWAATALPAHVQGVPVHHLAWSGVLANIGSARAAASRPERRYLDELHTYLRKAIRVRTPQDSWAYCVSVSSDRPGDGGPHTFREYLTAADSYFHPWGWGKGWPKTPPNFLAFRWGNHVQRAHRVMSHSVVPTLQTRWPGIPVSEETAAPHVVYDLGPQILPAPLPSGTNYRASRLWVLLDQLLTSPTLKEALAGTRVLTGS